MRKHCLILSFILTLYNIAVSQESSFEFGSVSMHDLEMQSFQGDTTVRAVILYEKGESTIERNWGTKFTIHRRIKFFKKDMADSWGTFYVRALKNKIASLKGASYNLENGAIVKTKLPEELRYKRKYSKTVDELGFTFSNIQDGTIIEYTYTVWYDYYTFMDWHFQHDIPVVRSEYSFQFLLPGGFNTDIRGNFTAQYFAKSEYDPHTWVMTNLPAFKPEPFMPHNDLYKSAIRLYPKKATWTTAYEQLILHPSFGVIMGSKNSLTKITREITKDLHTPREKLKAISNYIKTHVEWTGVYDFLSQDPEEVLKRGRGDSGDINVLLACLLEKAGLNFNVVLISTRENGALLQEVPSIYQFNYVICVIPIDDGYILMDATDKLLPYDVLPSHCSNLTGFLLNGKGYQWVELDSKAIYKTSAKANLTLNSNQELEGEIQFIKEGYTGFEARKDFLKKGEESYIQDIWKGRIVAIDKNTLENMDSIELPVREKFQLTIQDCTTSAGNMLYLNPFIVFQEEINPFKAEERIYPIDFGVGKEELLICNITIPDSFEVKQLPESKYIVIPGNSARFIVNYLKLGNQVQVTCNLQIKQPVFNETEYVALRELYARLISKKAEPIILERINK